MSAKLLAIAGPNRGATYFLQEGETVIGREAGVQIQLQHAQISKKHCIFQVSGAKVELLDAGSANGTFVNGVLAKKRPLQNQDRISVGPFVFELINTPAPVPRAARPMPVAAEMGGAIAPSASAADPVKEEEPKSLVAKYRKKFDEAVVPVFLDYHTKHDWQMVTGGVFVLFLVLNLFLSVAPILDNSKEELLRETEKRAIFIAKQVASLNRMHIQESKDALLNVDFAEEDPAVREAVIMNLDGRLMAPASRLNQMYEGGWAFERRKKMLSDQKLWNTYKRRFENDVAVFEPIMVLSKTKGINVPGAVAIVTMSTLGVALDAGTVQAIYFETFMISALLGVVFMYIVFQVTMSPIRKLHEDVEKVMRGESETVEKKYKSELLDGLIDSINTMASRLPKLGQQDTAALGAGVAQVDQASVDAVLTLVQNSAARLGHGALMLDPEKRVRYMNKKMEELVGFRLEGSQGDLVANVSRDQSFPAFMQEVTDKSVNAGGDGITEDYEFQGALHKVNCQAICVVPGKAEGFLIVAEKQEG